MKRFREEKSAKKAFKEENIFKPIMKTENKLLLRDFIDLDAINTCFIYINILDLDKNKLKSNLINFSLFIFLSNILDNNLYTLLLQIQFLNLNSNIFQ